MSRLQFNHAVTDVVDSDESVMSHHVIYTSRVAKVLKGGKRMRFRALVAVGDGKGRLGIALAKARDPKSAIEKAIVKAKKNVVTIKLSGDTIQYELLEKFKSARLFLKPAVEGTGIICSSSIRPMLELVGVKNIFVKMYGTSNKINNAYCLFNALSRFKV